MLVALKAELLRQQLPGTFFGGCPSSYILYLIGKCAEILLVDSGYRTFVDEFCNGFLQT